MNVGSLFTGIGGIDLGLKRAGHRVVFQCEGGGDPNGTKAERDQWAQGVYRRSVLAERFPGVECGVDVREAPDSLDGQVDLVCGGFPCQDLSVAGRRAGLVDGERSSLFFEFARIADAVLAPGGWVLLENVPGLLSSNGGRDFAVLLATLADLGFHDLAWRVLDSRHFGVAQRRRRVFIVARRARGSRACEVLLEPESSGGHPQTSREAGQGVAGTLGGGSGSRGWPQDTERMTFIPDTHARTLTAHERWDGETETFIADTLTSGSHPASNMPGRRREDDTNLAVVGVSENQRGELLETSYAHQLTSGGGKPGQGYPAARTPQGVRRLTPRECERLQGFPDDWTLIPGASDSKRYAALGDAVTVTVARWIGERLMRYAARDA